MSKKFVIFKPVWLFSLIIGILVPMVSFAVDPEEFKTVIGQMGQANNAVWHILT